MYEFCPLDGSPCFDHKLIKVLKLLGGKPVQIKICTNCAKPKQNHVWANFLHTIFHNLNIDKLLTPEQITLAINNIHDGKDLNRFLSSLRKQQYESKDESCPSCGLTSSELLNKGRAGCAECYKAFHEYLSPAISRLQNDALAHVGKRPKKSKIKDIEELEKSMAVAVREERYEDAAVCRDKIKELKK